MLGKIAGNKTDVNQEKTGMFLYFEPLRATITRSAVTGKPGTRIQMGTIEGHGSPKKAVASPKQTPSSPKKVPASPKMVRKSRSVAGISDNSRWVSEFKQL